MMITIGNPANRTEPNTDVSHGPRDGDRHACSRATSTMAFRDGFKSRPIPVGHGVERPMYNHQYKDVKAP